MNRLVVIGMSLVLSLQTPSFKPLSSEAALMKELSPGKAEAGYLESWLWPAATANQIVRRPALGMEDQVSILEWARNFLKEPFLMPNLDKNLVGFRTAKWDYVCFGYVVTNKYAIQVKDMRVSQAIAIRPESGEVLSASGDDQSVVDYVWSHAKQVFNLPVADLSQYEASVRRFGKEPDTLMIVRFEKKGQDRDIFKLHWSDSFYVATDMRTMTFDFRKWMGTEGSPGAATGAIDSKATARRWPYHP